MSRIACALFLVVLAVTLAAPSPSAAQGGTGSFVRVATWEETATSLPPGVWNEPIGIDLTPTGQLFTVDRRLRRVEVLDAAGSTVRTFGRGTAPEDLVAPEHVAVDESRDRVYVTDPGARRVAVYTVAGARVALWTGLGAPTGVGVAQDGRVVLTDVETDHVRVVALDGTEITSWGGTGTEPTQLDYPAGVHVAADDTVWVADRGNGRIVGTTIDGQPVTSFRLNAPNIAGAEPLDVSVDGDDLWVATEIGLARFSVENGGRSVRGFLADAPAAGVTADVAHGVYATVAADGDHPGVWRYLYGQGSGEPKERWGGPILVPGYFDHLEALTIGDDGAAYLLDVPPRVQRLDLAGLVNDQIDVPDPVEVDADAAGQLYTASADRIHALAADGSARWEARVRARGADAEVDIVGVAWDASGGRVLALDGGSKRLHSFGAAGAELDDIALRGAGGTGSYWTDLAVATDGTYYALDTGASQVRGWDAFDGLILELDLPEHATRFDLAPDGTVFVLSPSGWARQVARDGTVLAQWDVTRLDRGRGSRPADIAVDAGGRVYVADGAADIVTVFAWDPNAPREAPAEVEEGCVLESHKHAAPPEIQLGETVEISLVVRGTCAEGQSAADIGLLIDTSMDRSSLKSARRAAEHFLGLINPSSDLVAIQPGVDSSGRLTNDLQFLRRALRRMEAADAYNLGGAITSAEGELFGRRGRRDAKKVMVILFGSKRGDDVEYWEWYRIQRAAGQARRRGAEIFAVAMGRDTDVRLLYDIATTRAHVLKSRGNWELDAIYGRIASAIKPTILLSEVTITDELPDNMEYVEGSSQPPAVRRDRTLVWQLTDVPLSGTGVRYRVRPRLPGEWPTNVRAWADYVDGAGVAGRLDFPVPTVRVLAPTPIPTATVPPSATPPPEPTRTSSPEPTPTRSTRTIYVPIALGERCDPKSRPVDVALVLDASTSMLEPTSAGRRKLDAATDAASQFLDWLNLAHDQASIVTFNGAANVLQPLSADRAALDAALDAVAVAPQSRIDLGIAAAREELTSARHRDGNQRAMVVLTDGRANPVGPENAVAEAQLAQAAGTVVFTIGIGDDLDLDALARMASRPEYFYHSPDAEDLAAIYAQIAVAIPCPPDRFWGRRP